MEVVLFFMQDFQRHKIEDFDASDQVEKLNYTASKLSKTPMNKISILTENGINLSSSPSKPVLVFIPEGVSSITFYVISGDFTGKIKLHGEDSIKALLQQEVEASSSELGRSFGSILYAVEKLSLLIDESLKIFIHLLETVRLFQNSLTAIQKNLKLLLLLHLRNNQAYLRLHQEALTITPIVTRALSKVDNVIRFFETTCVPGKKELTLAEWFAQNVSSSTSIPQIMSQCTASIATFQESCAHTPQHVKSPYFDLAQLDDRQSNQMCDYKDITLYIKEKVDTLTQQQGHCVGLKKIISMMNNPFETASSSSSVDDDNNDLGHMLDFRETILQQEKKSLEFLNYCKKHFLQAEGWVLEILKHGTEICSRDEEVKTEIQFLSNLINQAHLVSEVLTTPIVFSRMMAETKSRANFDNEIDRWASQARSFFDVAIQEEESRRKSARFSSTGGGHFITKIFDCLDTGTCQNPIVSCYKIVEGNNDEDLLQLQSPSETLPDDNPQVESARSVVTTVHEPPVIAQTSMWSSPKAGRNPAEAAFLDPQLTMVVGEPARIQHNDSGLALEDESSSSTHKTDTTCSPHQDPRGGDSCSNDGGDSTTSASKDELAKNLTPPPSKPDLLFTKHSLFPDAFGLIPDHHEQALLASPQCATDKSTYPRDLLLAPDGSAALPLLAVRLLRDACERHEKHTQEVLALLLTKVKSQAADREESLMNSIKELQLDNDSLREKLKISNAQAQSHQLLYAKVSPGKKAVFVYDHRNRKYYIPQVGPEERYFLCTDDPAYLPSSNERVPLFEGVVASTRLVQIRLEENRFRLKVGSIFHLVKRELPPGGGGTTAVVVERK